MMPPVVCIVGRSNSGKTTLLAALVREFVGRGYRVAVVKHTPHGFDLQPPGKDSWRLLEAGAHLALVSGPEGVASFRRTGADTPLEGLLPALEEYDLVLAEGYRSAPFPRVEVHRRDLAPNPMTPPQDLCALVTDGDPPAGVPAFAPHQVAELADHLEATVVRPQRLQEGVSLVVNGQAVPLNPFARSVLARGVLGMVSALKGVGPVRWLVLRVRPGPPGEGHPPPSKHP